MNPAPNPVIVLWDVAYSDLVNIVDFMYNGEVKVRQANIQAYSSSGILYFKNNGNIFIVAKIMYTV